MSLTTTNHIGQDHALLRRHADNQKGRHASLVTPGATLWDIPASRSTDPATSRQAASSLASAEHGRKLSGKRMAVWSALHEMPGATAGEIAAKTGMERGEVSKRLPELVSMGWATRGPERECAVRGSQMTTWTARRVRLMSCA